MRITKIQFSVIIQEYKNMKECLPLVPLLKQKATRPQNHNQETRTPQNMHSTLTVTGQRGRVLKGFSYPSHNTDSLSRQKSWVAHFIVHDAVEYLFFIITWKRGLDISTRQGRTRASQFTELLFPHPIKHVGSDNGKLTVILSQKMGQKEKKKKQKQKTLFK